MGFADTDMYQILIKPLDKTTYSLYLQKTKELYNMINKNLSINEYINLVSMVV